LIIPFVGKSQTKGRSVKKPSLNETTIEKPMDNDTKRPKNSPANVLPSKGYVLEIDGKFKSEFGTSETAMKAGLELKKKYPQIQINVYGAKERTRTRVVLSD
jgi:hypothetical protein